MLVLFVSCMCFISHLMSVSYRFLLHSKKTRWIHTKSIYLKSCPEKKIDFRETKENLKEIKKQKAIWI